MGAKESILKAARADMIPRGRSGLWFVLKFACTDPLTVPRGKTWNGGTKTATIPRGTYTQLWRQTLEKMHHKPPGEVVMMDTPDELKTHLNFMLRAHGDVLITGLGLGCVARGCLANPFVRSVTVLEQDRDVLRLVAPHVPKKGQSGSDLKIVHVDALSWADVLSSQPLVRYFDCAWHDLWSDPDDDKAKHLQLMHSHLIAALADRVRDFQGAWQLPRWFRHRLDGKLGHLI